MELATRTGKNLFFKFSGEAAARALAFFFYVLAARYLGADNFGKYSFAYSFTVLFVLFADIGLSNIIIRDVAGNNSLFPLYYGNANSIKLILSAITLAVLYIINIVSGYSLIYGNLIFLMGIVAIATSWLEYQVSIFNAFEKMHYEAVLKTLNRLLLLGFGFAALKSGAGIDGFLISMIAAYSASLAVGFIIITRRIHKPVISLQPEFAGALISSSMPVFLSIVFMMAYHHAGVVMLSLYGAAESDIAIYSIALKIMEVLSVASLIFALASYPVLADFFGRSKDLFLDAYRRTLKFAFLAGATGAAITSALSREIILILFGPAFSGAAPVLALAAWVFIFMFANHAIMQAFIILRRQKINIFSAAAALGVNILLNILLIPRHGFMGVAAAVLATEAFLFFINAWVSYALKIRSGLLRSLWRLAVPAAVSAGVILLLKPGGLMGLSAAIAIFAAAIITLKPFDAEDVEYAKKILSAPSAVRDIFGKMFDHIA